MHDIRFVQNGYTEYHLGDVELDPIFRWEPGVMLEHFMHFSPGYKRHHEVKAFFCREIVVHRAQKRIVAFEEHLVLYVDSEDCLSVLN